MGIRLTIQDADFSNNNVGNSNPLIDFYNMAGIVSSAQRAVYQSLYDSLNTAGLIGPLKRLHLFTENKEGSILNILNASDQKASVASGYDSRFTQAGVSFNKDMLINIPFANEAGNDDIMFGCYNSTAEAGSSSVNNFLCKTNNAAPYMMLSRNLASYYGYRITGTINTYPGADLGPGLMAADLKGTVSNLYKNGVVSQTTNETTTSPATTTMSIGDETICTMRAFVGGKSLTTSQHTALWNALDAFNTGWNAL